MGYGASWKEKRTTMKYYQNKYLKHIKLGFFIILISIMKLNLLGYNDDSSKKIEKRIVLKNDSTIFSLIENLDEVIELENRIDNDSNYKCGMLMAEEPDSSSLYYIVRVGISGPELFVSHFTFYIHKYSLEIFYYDAVEDELVSLKDWRVMKKNQHKKQ